VRVALTALECEKGDVPRNLGAHLAVLDGAADAGCAWVVFPEYSLTGSVDAQRHPERAISIDDASMHELVAATTDIGAVFGLGERDGNAFFITQVVARGGEIVGTQRKRVIAPDEIGHAAGHETLVVDQFGLIICREADVDWTWDATRAAGADVVFFCSAPGLDGRRLTEADMRAGYEWWRAHGLGRARTQAQRLGVWVGMSTQAGSTIDEEFPGIAALVSPTGDVVAESSHWHEALLVVEIPETSP
jgi:predicted amidohydrolase